MKNYVRDSYTDDTMKSKVNKERDRVSKKNGLTWRIRETIKSVDLKKSTIVVKKELENYRYEDWRKKQEHWRKGKRIEKRIR